MSTTYKLILDGAVYVLGENEIRARQVAAERGGRLVKVEEPEPSELSNA
jgi:hypothetical protein